jgi:hypothetical protein
MYAPNNQGTYTINGVFCVILYKYINNLY